MKWKKWWMVLFLALGLIGFARAGGACSDGWYYYHDEYTMTRYNPSTGVAQYLHPESNEWINDEYIDSNPAYMAYQASDDSCGVSGSSSLLSANGYNTAIGRSKAVHGKMEYMNGRYYVFKEQTACRLGQECGYKDSNLPSWSTHLFGGVSYDQLDYGVSSGTLYADTEITTVEGGAIFQKDQFSILTSARYEYASGHKSFNDLRSDTYGLLLMPSYCVFRQSEDLLNAYVYAFLDLSFVDMSNEDNQWRMMPGVAASLSRSTPIGSFMAGYSYAYNRNQGGDIEVTGSHHINSHNTSLSYVLPIMEKVYLASDLENTYIPSTPKDLDHDFTDVRIRLGAVQLNNWNVSMSYYFSVDSSGNKGGDLMVGYTW